MPYLQRLRHKEPGRSFVMQLLHSHYCADSLAPQIFIPAMANPLMKHLWALAVGSINTKRGSFDLVFMIMDWKLNGQQDSGSFLLTPAYHQDYNMYLKQYLIHFPYVSQRL